MRKILKNLNFLAKNYLSEDNLSNWQVYKEWLKAYLYQPYKAQEKLIDFQKKFGLKPDGIIGCKTQKALIANDFHFQIDTPPSVVLTTGRGFYLAPEYNVALRILAGNISFSLRDPEVLPINIIVLHWDVTPSSRKTAEVLARRKNASADLLLSKSGEIYLTAPWENYYFYHATIANKYSIGIEINNPFYLKYAEKDIRPIWEEVLPRGRKRKYLGFTDAQIFSVCNFIEKFYNYYNFEQKKVLVDLPERGVLTKEDLVRMSKDKATLYVIGHYHVSTRKIDPGYTLMRKVKEELYDVREKD